MKKIKRRSGIMIVLSLATTMLLGSGVFASEMGVLEDSGWEKINIVKKYVSESYSELSEAEQAELAAKIYQEKYIGSTAAYLNADEETSEDFVDMAYQIMVEREMYVAELISAHSGIETTTAAWEYNLNYLKHHYEEIMAIEGVNSIFVDRYIEDYEAELAARDILAAKENGIRVQASSYSATDAVAYAEKYYDTYNSEYPDWTSYGGDCANFISQCLYAGGKSMQGTPGTSTAAQDMSNWFSTGSSCNTKNVSSTWRGANAFKTYWLVNASDSSKFSAVDSDSYDFGYKGDAVSLLNSNGSAYHTLIIVGYDYDIDNPDFIVAAHTSNTKTKHLSEYTPAGGFIIYNMK